MTANCRHNQFFSPVVPLISDFFRKLAKRQAQTVLRKLNYTRRHNENPAINPRDVESSGGSYVRGLGVLVPAKASL